MFGIGPLELVIIAMVALIFIGPQKLPEVMKQIGQFLVHMKGYGSTLRSEIDEVVHDVESEIKKEELKKLIKPDE